MTQVVGWAIALSYRILHNNFSQVFFTTAQAFFSAYNSQFEKCPLSIYSRNWQAGKWCESNRSLLTKASSDAYGICLIVCSSSLPHSLPICRVERSRAMYRLSSLLLLDLIKKRWGCVTSVKLHLRPNCLHGTWHLMLTFAFLLVHGS